MRKLKVLSLFDGMSCGRVALHKAGIPVDTYYSSEIDKYAIKIANKNHPQDSNNRLGDINDWSSWSVDFSEIDLILAGSPCQSISNLGDGSGLKGKSGLFFKFLEILNHVKKLNPNVKFLLENVKGKKDAIEDISTYLGVKPYEINSNRFSAQNRKRLYWTNIEFELSIKDTNTLLVDILEDGIPEDSILSKGRLKWLMSEKGQNTISKKYAVIDPDKAQCLTARSDASWNSNYVTRNGVITKLTPVEYERLQTLPDNYTQGVSNSQRYKMLGNGWTVDVISHILKSIS